MFIPKKCKVGWVKRDDCYNKTLAYIIYYDEKGKLRKETSFEGWRDKKITPMDFDNVPTSGIVLNKGIKRGGWDHFSQVVQKVRVYDPRCGGMEFEITISNLLYILMHDDCTKRELSGEYVYAYSGSDLVLLPVSSENYVKAVESTSLKDMSVKKADLVPGYHYLTKQEAVLMYVGEFYLYDNGSDWGDNGKYQTTKRMVFTVVSGFVNNSRRLVRKDYSDHNWVFLSGLTSLAKLQLDVVSEDLPLRTQQILGSRFNKGKIDGIVTTSEKLSFSYPKTISTKYIDYIRDEKDVVQQVWAASNASYTGVHIEEYHYLVKVDEKTFRKISVSPIYPPVPLTEEELKKREGNYWYYNRNTEKSIPFGGNVRLEEIEEIVISGGYLETKSKKIVQSEIPLSELQAMAHVSLDLKVGGKFVSLNDYLNNKI